MEALDWINPGSKPRGLINPPCLEGWLAIKTTITIIGRSIMQIIIITIKKLKEIKITSRAKQHQGGFINPRPGRGGVRLPIIPR